ncbi:hypothetical protein JCM10207_005365 [Rhodosporidiobolus poonsookiae]
MAEPDSHDDWRLVLVDKSQRKVVLHSPAHNRFAVAESLPTRSHFSPRLAGQLASLTLPAPQRTPSPLSGQLTSLGKPSQASSPPTLPDESASSSHTATPGALCPLCYQPVPQAYSPGRQASPPRHSLLPLPPSDTASSAFDSLSEDDEPRRPTARDSTARTWVAGRMREKEGAYFELLSEANSLANSPNTTGRTSARLTSEEGELHEESGLSENQMNEGYGKRFFEELQLLGRGGQGSVYLVRHVLNGEGLGLYALKKIPVGDSTPSLLRVLREVHLLESLSHHNIISYHHAWLDSSQPSSFSPPVPTLHVLMAFANGGSLQDFVHQRGGGAPDNEEMTTRERRKERFKQRRKGALGGDTGKAVHLLRVEDLLELFKDVVVGLSFLHSRNILHLDLKAENVLLHWDEDALLPTCKLSDFGNATNDSYHRERHGGSGTLAYTPPEAWLVDGKTGKLSPPDRAIDLWALGLILHLLCFFALPWRHEDDMAQLEKEIRAYRGFFPSDVFPSPPSSLSSATSSHALTARHDLPPSLLLLLSTLINLSPSHRPSCERVEKALHGIRADAADLAATGGFYPPYAGEGGEGGAVMQQRPRYPPVRRAAVVPWIPAGLPAPPTARRRRSDEEGRRQGSRSRRALTSGSEEEEAADDEGRWLVLPQRPSHTRRASSPALEQAYTVSAPPASPRLPLPPPSPHRALTPPRKAQRLSLRLASRQRATVQNQLVAAAVAFGKLLLLPRSLKPALSSALPTWLVALLLLETAIDIAAANLWVTVGVLVAHVGLVGALARAM